MAALIQRQTNGISTPSIFVFFIAPEMRGFPGSKSGRVLRADNADRMVGEWRV
ncbi:hypothetical protein G3N59_13745 [Paraburkholderia sp. Ac-20340]|uniref:hypothetical protein n=1 Tax=Paraburkholderia sp. Ac-20340 TaxID=2703888 RepID=UPI001981E8E5|nr:hypothetical protein [Paraburkholderia sp. Ac-20340]MBN3854445.1 hypothetical protein [Paraburkholderia sp. Ac-20340]